MHLRQHHCGFGKHIVRHRVVSALQGKAKRVAVRAAMAFNHHAAQA